MANKFNNFCVISIDWKDVVSLCSSSFVNRKQVIVAVVRFAGFPWFSKGLEKIISWNRRLALEVWKPEDTSLESAKILHDFFIDVVVYDILKINLIEVICPWVEHREALVFNSLSTILLDIFFDKCKVSFISWNWVGKIILVNSLFRVADEGVNCLDARWGLKVLVLDLCINSRGQQVKPSYIKSFEDAEEHGFKTLHVPVLVDSSVDDVWSENLLWFVSQQENQIVEVVNRLKVANVLLAVVWDKLLED